MSNRRDRPAVTEFWPANAAFIPLFVAGATFAWWAWSDGAYFDTAFIPGAIVLFALGLALAVFAPWPGSLAGPARVALLALAGLGAWTLASALWSPEEAVAISDAQRVFTYAAAFGLGIWVCLLMGPRMLLSLTPLAVAGAVVAVAALVALWLGEDAAELFERDSTVRLPLGYGNAVAGFFGAAVPPMIAVAASKDTDWRISGALVGAATLSMEMAVLSQSRGALLAGGAGAAVLILVHPARLRIAGYLLLASLPAAASLPWVLEVSQEGHGDPAAAVEPLSAACAAMAVTAGLAAVLGAVVARAEPLPSPAARRGATRLLLAALFAVVLLGILALARAEGGPGEFLEERADQVSDRTPELGGDGGRPLLDLNSYRADMWAVGIDEFGEEPITGVGAGGFRAAYLDEREALSIAPEDPHGVWVLMASELGLPGLALLAVFLVAVTAGALRARSLGPAAGALSAGALAAAAFWLTQASLDWFWHYPALTAPIAFTLGAAVAPALLRPAGPRHAGRRALLGCGAVLAAVSLVPFFLSERYTKDSLALGADDPEQAFADLDTASDLNPWSTTPESAAQILEQGTGAEAALRGLDDPLTAQYSGLSTGGPAPGPGDQEP